MTATKDLPKRIFSVCLVGFHTTIQLENTTKSVELGEDKNLFPVGYSGLFFSLRKPLLGAGNRDLGPGRNTYLAG